MTMTIAQFIKLIQKIYDHMYGFNRKIDVLKVTTSSCNLEKKKNTK